MRKPASSSSMHPTQHGCRNLEFTDDAVVLLGLLPVLPTPRYNSGGESCMEARGGDLTSS